MRDNQEMYFVFGGDARKRTRRGRSFFPAENNRKLVFGVLLGSFRADDRPSRRKRTQSHHRRTKSFFGFIASFFHIIASLSCCEEGGERKKDNERIEFLFFFFPGLFVRSSDSPCSVFFFPPCQMAPWPLPGGGVAEAAMGASQPAGPIGGGGGPYCAYMWRNGKSGAGGEGRRTISWRKEEGEGDRF